jgi:hypothetical protein
MERIMDTPERRAFWTSIRESAQRVKARPYCLRGGSAAEEHDREIQELESNVAQLQAAARERGQRSSGSP